MWLLTTSKDEKVLIPLELATSYKARTKGLIGRQKIESPMLIKPAYLGVHTFGVKFPLDVAFLDERLKVLKITQMKPYRIANCLRSRAVLEAPLGSFRTLGIQVGKALEISSTYN